eukprot:TRINITY_DN24561_c0_g1_i1.p1 TRINITY_DN24561_c0_g1~~TRINITY_DN24561_c0_g1_i1.p1  ORF type:complete len:363 (-),score=67.07 TRINITY_DN24561_c0_g1_i1:101-1189(-)
MAAQEGAAPLFTPCKSVLSAASAEDVKRCYFQTSKHRAFRGRGPERDKDAKSENMINVHFVGQRLENKYLKFQVKTAPLLDRASCHYHKDFLPRPLGDNVMNREMAKVNKAGKGPATTQAAFSDSTQYNETFRPPTAKEAQEARRQDASFSREELCKSRSVLSPVKQMLETSAASHLHFPQRPASCQSWASSVPARAPPDNLSVHKSAAVTPTTAYRQQFGGPGKKPGVTLDDLEDFDVASCVADRRRSERVTGAKNTDARCRSTSRSSDATTRQRCVSRSAFTPAASTSGASAKRPSTAPVLGKRGAKATADAATAPPAAATQPGQRPGSAAGRSQAASSSGSQSRPASAAGRRQRKVGGR